MLEKTLGTLRGDERIGALYAWFATLEKNNPTLANVVLKTWLEALPGVKWATTILGPSSSSSSSSSGDAKTESASDPVAASNLSGAVELQHTAVLEAIRETHPDVFDAYHVVLIPKEKVDDATGPSP